MRMLRAYSGAAAILSLMLLFGASALAESFRPIFNPPALRFEAVNVSEPFQGLDGKTLEPGTYDFEFSAKGTTAIIGVLRSGKRVAETKGKPVVVQGQDKVSDADVYFDAKSELSHEGNRFKLLATSITNRGPMPVPMSPPSTANPSGYLLFELPPVKARGGK